MATFVVLLLASVLLTVQSAPVDVDSSSSASSAMHLLVKDSEDTKNYHLTPFRREIDDMEDEITAELDALLPYINFLMDTLFGGPKSDEDSECIDDMVIQLVPEKSSNSEDDDSSDADDSAAAVAVAAA